ncbi:MAG TPA: hypothetical protein PKW62_06065 [Chitinophagaceae bacterium]|nr:hypothetical protein [Chitinophagaceae bacterium]
MKPISTAIINTARNESQHGESGIFSDSPFFAAYRHPVRKKTGLSSFFVVLAFGRIFDELETGKTIDPVNK